MKNAYDTLEDIALAFLLIGAAAFAFCGIRDPEATMTFLYNIFR